jgi:hypothetical protein
MKHNYLNNKDILKEIHKSKNTYCSFLDASCSDYDLIIHDLKLVTAEIIQLAKENRAERLAKLALEESASRGEKRKLDEFLVPIESVNDLDVVIRVMTWEHVPVNDELSKKAVVVQEPVDDEDIYIEYDDGDSKPPKDVIKYVKCNFPPFQHYKIDPSGTLYCVGKSHWKGDLVAGKWSRDHGTMTRTLATMFMKLCERYATRSNWRGYTYNDEMRSQALLQLSQIGLQFDESKSSNPFAYYTAAITNSFTRVLNIEKRNQNLRDDILEINGFNPSYTRQGMNVGYSNDGDHD